MSASSRRLARRWAPRLSPPARGDHAVGSSPPGCVAAIRSSSTVDHHNVDRCASCSSAEPARSAPRASDSRSNVAWRSRRSTGASPTVEISPGTSRRSPLTPETSRAWMLHFAGGRSMSSPTFAPSPQMRYGHGSNCSAVVWGTTSSSAPQPCIRSLPRRCPSSSRRRLGILAGATPKTRSPRRTSSPPRIATSATR